MLGDTFASPSIKCSFQSQNSSTQIPGQSNFLPLISFKRRGLFQKKQTHIFFMSLKNEIFIIIKVSHIHWEKLEDAKNNKEN